MLKDQFEKLLYDFKNETAVAENPQQIFLIEKKYLGRKGKLTRLMKELRDLSDKEKKEVGRLANDIKSEMEQSLSHLQRKTEIADESKPEIDITLPGIEPKKGSLHPITATQYELEDIFTSLGFVIEDGPEVESEYYNFDALNIPPHHPARDMQDTFFTEDGNLLRTHTSPIQIRAMKKYGAPLRLIAPGAVYRYEASDASHDYAFNQIEGLLIDKDVSIANLIAIAKQFLSRIFKDEVEVRLRPGYFPFVEPGFELDLRCVLCQGSGCSTCKYTGWIEFMGSGLVHPNVLEAGGIDPKSYSGFAFGFGLDRLIMMRYGINDIRLFHSDDIRFLEQF